GIRGGGQLLPDLEPVDAGQECGRIDRTLAEDRRSSDTIRGEGAQRVAARCADRHRGQDVAGLWPAALRPVTFLRGSDEPAEWRTARREYEPPSRGPCIHAEQDHEVGRAHV